ncbi:Sigma cross-reacting protein 27A [Pseudoalteromonas luteoviolacea B = ATCC 29581]|nr:Sigma cross-reacting protein 27A [Pseudoalteromonas luteoviolacea B = ATCC 29581]
MKTVAIILAGCGVFDGSEIHEAVLTLLHVTKQGAKYQCFAPDIEQMHTINHISGEPMAQTRNVMVESARIARGEIKPIRELQVEAFDALIIPGGFGAAKNLCDFAVKGAAMTVHNEIEAIARAFALAKKPAGYLCIAPAMIPKIYGAGVKATIGTDSDTATALTAMGAHHIDCKVDDIVIDDEHVVISTPAYMLATNIAQADAGIAKLVNAVLARA